MDVSADNLPIEAIYKLLTGLIVPRPIAWVTSLSSTGVVNLAPFSAFTFLSTKPPIIGISLSLRSGMLKDTARNIEATGEFVVNTASDDLADAVHESSREHSPDVSEPQVLGLDLIQSGSVAVPRLAAAPAAMECKLERIVEFGEMGAKLFAGQIVRFHVRDDLVVDGRIPTDRLRPLGRISGPRYVKLGEIIEAAPLHEGSKIYAKPSN